MSHVANAPWAQEREVTDGKCEAASSPKTNENSGGIFDYVMLEDGQVTGGRQETLRVPHLLSTPAGSLFTWWELLLSNKKKSTDTKAWINTETIN